MDLILEFTVGLFFEFLGSITESDATPKWVRYSVLGAIVAGLLTLIILGIIHATEGIAIFLLVLLGSGVISMMLGLVIAVTSPFLGAMYTFFFSNIAGKQISKSIFTGGILCGILWLMEHFGLVVILITPAALLTYIPLALVLLVLWFLIGHLL